MSETVKLKTSTSEEHVPVSKEDLRSLIAAELITRKMALEYARVAIEKRGLGSTELDLLGITTEEQVARICREVESAIEQLRSEKSGA